MVMSSTVEMNGIGFMVKSIYLLFAQQPYFEMSPSITPALGCVTLCIAVALNKQQRGDLGPEVRGELCFLSLTGHFVQSIGHWLLQPGFLLRFTIFSGSLSLKRPPCAVAFLPHPCHPCNLSKAWVKDVAKWNFRRIIPAHLQVGVFRGLDC